MEQKITIEYLRKNPNHIFVFGDNLLRKGKGGAATLRDEPNTYGFITKKYPTYSMAAYYMCKEYESVYQKELEKLIQQIVKNSDKMFLISKLGAGLANKFHIFENIIEPKIKEELSHFKNVKFLW